MPGRFAKALFITAFLAVCTGCASEEPSPEVAVEARLSHIFGIGLKQVATYYLEPLDPRRAALDGLEGLTTLEPGFALDAANSDLSAVDLFVDGDQVDTVALPKPNASDLPTQAKAWGAFAADIAIRARAASPTLAAIDEEVIQDAFFDAMTNGLDRFSGYASRREAARNRAGREGYGGIGVALEPHPDGALIGRIVPEGPAAAAGIHPGDRLLAIDGHAVSGFPISRIVSELRGPINATVSLTLGRKGLAKPIIVTVGRKRIVPNTVFFEPMGRFAIIRVSGFNQSTTKRLAEAVAKAHQALGDDLAGIILDLRGNPGGLMEEAVHAADLFLDVGVISRAAGRHPESQQLFHAELGDIAAGVPIAVLINGATASASEILAAALQDHGRAVVIGMSSFGKGSIQTVIDLPNGGELYLTWAKFMAPSGYTLDRMGVMPSVCTSGASDAVTALDSGLSKGKDSGRANLVLRRETDVSTHTKTEVQAVLALCPWNPHTLGDVDLAVAELLLGSPAVYRQAIAISLSGTS